MALSSTAHAEEITKFQSDIEIQDDGTLFVTESVQYDFGYESRHGIYRKIPDTYSGNGSTWYKDRYVKLQLLSVTKDGVAEPYTRQFYNGLSLKIGDPNITTTGTHIYKVTYKVSGAILKSGDKNELYWNVTGNDWNVPMGDVKATLWAKDGVLQDVYYCYAGSVDSKQACTSAFFDGQASVFSENDLWAGEGLTVAQEVQLTAKPVIFERFNELFLYSVAFVVWLIGLSLYATKWRFKYWKSRSIIAQYEPLPDFKPMFTGVLFDNALDPRDITAGIVYLAQQGFISIKKTTEKVLLLFEVDDYEVVLNRPLLEIEDSASHRELLRLLFDNESGAGSVVYLSKLKRDPKKMRQNYVALQGLKSATKKDLRERTYFEQYPTKIGTIAATLFLVIFFVLSQVSVGAKMLHGIIFVELILGTLLCTLIFISNRRTIKGYEALNHLKGFKEFLSVTDKERFAFHNAPTLSPEVFMEYLPYAIAFGVEEKWSEVFKDIQIGNPDWYSGNGNISAFNAAVLSSHLSMFSNSFVGASPSSSSSSASFGGGFSGGGFGGGGGGSW